MSLTLMINSETKTRNDQKKERLLLQFREEQNNGYDRSHA